METEVSAPAALTDLPIQCDPPRKRSSRRAYESLCAATAGSHRLELVDGDLIGNLEISGRTSMR